MFQEQKELSVGQDAHRGQYAELADAIRRGSRLVPQCFNQTVQYAQRLADWSVPGAVLLPCASLDIPIAACAIGAAQLVGYDWTWIYDESLPQVACPTCRRSGFVTSVSAVIVHLNDSHRWTREAIADWVEGL